MRLIGLALFGTLLISSASSAFAIGREFTDLTPESSEYEAVQELVRRGIITGYPDGTFGSHDPVNRAEAITILVRAVANVENLPGMDHCFPDVSGDVWYVKPVCYAFDLGWVSGYPDGTYQPEKTVARAEFIKILLNAYGIDTEELNEYFGPLALDVRDEDAWYTPYMSYGIAYSLFTIDEESRLYPGAALTRKNVAELVYAFLLWKEGKHKDVQAKMHSADIASAFHNIAIERLDRADEAIVRAGLCARAMRMRAANKTGAGFQDVFRTGMLHLTHAHRLKMMGETDLALEAVQEAYRLASEADAIAGSTSIETDRLRIFAHGLAEEIRMMTEQ